MLEGVFYCNTAFGAESEAFFHKINGKWIRFRKEMLEIDSLPEREGTQIFSRSSRGNGIKIVDRGRAKGIKDERQLMVICWE